MIIETKYGKLSGIEAENYRVYRGVPYAKPPVGNLRFQRPQKPEPWEGVYQADHFRAKSMQRGRQVGSFYDREFYSNPDFDVDMSEDCLYLNIWTPKKEGKKYPVAIYVHGGAFMGGAGSNLPFVGEAFAKREVILITINYRLGMLGFLCHPLLNGDSEGDICGNYGLWDQIAALDWVRENIAAFGGDPENITLFGQSAGAMSLQILALSPFAEGKYQKMILQSGGGLQNPLMDYRLVEKAYEVGEDLLEALGMEPHAWERNAQEKRRAMELLHETPVEQMMEAAGTVIGKSFQKGTGIPFLPVVDGVLLGSDGNDLMREGKFAKVPFILGANAEDITVDMEKERSQETNQMHLANVRFAHLVNDAGEPSAYVYYFSRQLPGDESGAFHSAELWYVFGSLEYCWRPLTEEDRQLSDRMMDYWVNFMYTGNPNGDNLAEWRPCTREDSYVQVLDV